MASQIGELVGVHERLGRSLEEWQEPGARELCDLVERKWPAYQLRVVRDARAGIGSG